eukprot:11130852-Alexandrium_andersonii.AAC.1
MCAEPGGDDEKRIPGGRNAPNGKLSGPQLGMNSIGPRRSLRLYFLPSDLRALRTSEVGTPR